MCSGQVNYRDDGLVFNSPSKGSDSDYDQPDGDGDEDDAGAGGRQRSKAAASRGEPPAVEEEKGDKYARIHGFSRRERTKFVKVRGRARCRVGSRSLATLCCQPVLLRVSSIPAPCGAVVPSGPPRIPLGQLAAVAWPPCAVVQIFMEFGVGAKDAQGQFDWAEFIRRYPRKHRTHVIRYSTPPTPGAPPIAPRNPCQELNIEYNRPVAPGTQWRPYQAPPLPSPTTG